MNGKLTQKQIEEIASKLIGTERYSPDVSSELFGRIIESNTELQLLNQIVFRCDKCNVWYSVEQRNFFEHKSLCDKCLDEILDDESEDNK